MIKQEQLQWDSIAREMLKVKPVKLKPSMQLETIILLLGSVVRD